MGRRVLLTVGAVVLAGSIGNASFSLVWGNRGEGDFDGLWEECVGDLPIDEQQPVGECECERLGFYWYDDECWEEPDEGGG